MSSINSIQNEYLQRVGFSENLQRPPVLPTQQLPSSDMEGFFPDKSIPLDKLKFSIYDAVVDQQGFGTHLSIQDALSSGKKRIFVRSGTYVLDKDIVINSSNVKIVGESREGSIITFPSSLVGSYSLLSISGDVSDIEIANLQFDGDNNEEKLIIGNMIQGKIEDEQWRNIRR
jgi:hypothetical protein